MLRGKVTVAFSNGGVYDYTNVSRRACIKFVIDDARSLGKFVNNVPSKPRVSTAVAWPLPDHILISSVGVPFGVAFMMGSHLSPVHLAYTHMAVLNRTYEILGREFDTDELARTLPTMVWLLVLVVLSTPRELRDIFDDNDDEIQDYLSDWVHDNIGDDESSFSYFAKDVEDITQLKGQVSVGIR